METAKPMLQSTWETTLHRDTTWKSLHTMKCCKEPLRSWAMLENIPFLHFCTWGMIDDVERKEWSQENKIGGGVMWVGSKVVSPPHAHLFLKISQAAK